MIHSWRCGRSSRNWLPLTCANGYRRLTVLLRRVGWKVNAKRIYRLYLEEGLMVRTKQRKKIARRQRVAMPGPIRPGQRWSMDFVSDKLADGRGFRILTVIDQFTRECVLLEAQRSMSGDKVAEALQRVTDGEGQHQKALPATTAANFPVACWKHGP